jgi:hypothetical protein
MKQIKAPDGSIINFPDGTPDSVIINTMAKAYGGSGTNKDYPNPAAGLRVDPGAVRQTLGLPQRAPAPPAGLFGDKKAPYGVGGMVAASVGARPKAPVAVDMAKSVPTGLAEGTAGLLGLPADGANAVVSGLDWAGRNLGRATGLYTPEQYDAAMVAPRSAPQLKQPLLPTSRQVNDTIQGATGPYYQPQTTAGGYARTIASFVPGSLSGGQGAAGRLMPAVLGGGASETAGLLTKGTPYEPWARLAGGAVGAGIGGAVTQPARASTEIYNATKNATPTDLAAAAARLKAGQAQGIHLTWPEALDSVTQGRTNATRLLRTAESTKEGSAKLAPQLSARPAQVQAAINANLNKIAPPVTDPFSLASRAQQAGEGVISRMSSAVQANAEPIYARLPGNKLPISELDPATGQMVPKYGLLKNDPSYQEALADLRNNPRKNNAPVVRGQPLTYANLPDNDLAVINKVSTNLGTMSDKAAGTPMNPGDRWDASLISDAKGLADQLASEANPDYALARQTYGTGQQAFVDPLRVGPIGTLARSADRSTALNGQTAALYPSASEILPGASNTIGTNLGLLNEVDPGVASALTRQHLEGVANETAGKVGPNNLPDPWGGAKFARKVDGSPEQSANLRAGIGAAAGDPTASDWSDLLDVLHTTGARVKPSQGAASFGEDMHDFERAANLAGALPHALANPNPGDWLKRAGDTYERWRLGKVGGEIADTTTGTPDEQMQALTDAYNKQPSGVGGTGLRALLPAAPTIPFPQAQPAF